MTDRSTFLVHIMEKLALPLMQAVTAVSLRAPDAAASDTRKDAEKLAELIAKTVQASLGLSESLKVTSTDASGDAVRLALTASASPLIANYYTIAGKAPTDQDVKKMVTSMQAVLGFADNFAATAENELRLQNVDPDYVPGDKNQINIQFVSAMVPVINSIHAFSFGRSEEPLVKETGNRLLAKMDTVCIKIYGGTDAPKDNPALGIRVLKALSGIYASCHQEETVRVMSMAPEDRAKLTGDNAGLLPMDNIWTAFDQRVSMMVALGRSAFGMDDEPAQSQSQPDAATAAQPSEPKTPPPPPPPAPASPSVDEGAADQNASGPPADDSAAQPASPFSAFTKKPAAAQGQDDKSDAPAAPPAPPAPPQTTAPEPPLPEADMPTDPLGSVKPIETPEPPDDPDDADNTEKPAGDPANPMSFFGKPKKTETEDDNGGNKGA